MEERELIVPLDVPASMRDAYAANERAITRGTGRLMFMAGDQRMEHLNDDFYGPGVADAMRVYRGEARWKGGVE